MDKTSRLPLPAALGGTAFFLLWGLAIIAFEVPYGWVNSDVLGIVLLTIVIFVLPIGMLIGWIHGFPRWSYPYVGHVLLFSLYLMNVSTPGFLFDREPIGWRAWIPFLVVAGTAIAVTRSFKPIARSYKNILQDWSLLTYGMFGFMPLVILIAFDEMDRLYSLYFMVALTVLMCATAFLYLYGRDRRQQISALVIGLILTIIVSILGPAFFWKETQWMGQIRVITAGIVIMLSPALIEILPKYLSRKTV